VLILGGGDGMAAREALKYRSVEQVDLVDIDKEMLRLFTKNPMLSGLSQHAFSDPRMKVHVMDAGKFMEESPEQWDLIFMDLPDPSSLSLGRLYTNAFFKLVATKLNESGILTTQATSPFYAPEAFWSIVKTLGHTPIGPEGDLRLQVYPYHTHIPSFGDWGFIMASKIALNPEKLKPVDGIAMKFLSAELMPTLFIFPKDVAMRDVRVNRPDDQVIAEYYRRAWKRFTP
jgi:spermidine synthase